MYAHDSTTRHDELFRRGRVLKVSLNTIFSELFQKRHIVSFRVIRETSDSGHLIFHIRYECVIRSMGEEQTVELLFDLDTREMNSTTTRVSVRARFSKFLLSPTFDPVTLRRMIRRTVLQWKAGMRNEIEFAGFLTKLAEQPRIHQAYKTGKHEDKKKGIDFVVCFFLKPYWELSEVKFNLKSSEHYIERHKEKHPTIGTFVFRSDKDLSNANSKKMLTRRFVRFLLTSSKVTEAVHM